MKKLLTLAIVALSLAACNESGGEDAAARAKDSLDSIANAKIQVIDSSADAKIDAIDSTTEAKKQQLDSTLNNRDTANNNNN